MALGFKDVLKAWLQEEGCEVQFETVTGRENPSIMFVQKKDGVRSWFSWQNVVEAWNNGLTAKAIAARISVSGAGKQEV